MFRFVRSDFALPFFPAVLVGFVLSAAPVHAGFVKFVDQAFTGSDAPGWTFVRGGEGDGPLLTAKDSQDVPGEGWLRLTHDGNNEGNFVWNDTIIPTRWGIVVEFDFVTWSEDSSLGDGFAVVLFDADVDDPDAGGYGGSLGYAQRTNIVGLAGGVVGIGFDEFGNFSDPGEGREGGHEDGRQKDSIAIRGSMGDDRSDGYEYVTGTGTLDHPFAIANRSDRPDGTNDTDNWVHSVRITIDTTQEMTVEMKRGTNDWEALIDRHPCELDCPEVVRIGFTSGTGQSTAYHEIRNLQVGNAQAIPEPGSISLAFGVGLVALVLWRRRRAATGG